MANLLTAFPLTQSQNNLGGHIGMRRDMVLNWNAFLDQFALYLSNWISDYALTTAVPTIGTTVTMATPAQSINIAGVQTNIAAETAKAFGALGTIPASKWGLIAIDRVAAATTTFVSATANYTTGYATEALAIAANPAKTANKARTGYITILASASTWVAGTDALAGGTGGNPATTTNYYGITGLTDPTFFTCSRIGNTGGTEIVAGVY